MAPLPINDVVYGRTWEVLTLKNSIEPPQILVKKDFPTLSCTKYTSTRPFLPFAQLPLPLANILR